MAISSAVELAATRLLFASSKTNVLIAAPPIPSFGVGALAVYRSLSSLIATLGMNYMLRGLIMIITQGKSIALRGVKDTWLLPFLTGGLSSFPTQIIWGLLFVIISTFIYNICSWI